MFRTLRTLSFALPLIAMAVTASADTFNLALLGLGPNVEPVYIETDADGPRVVLVKALGNYVMINPRKAQDYWKAGMFCWEFVPGWAELLAVPNPSKKWQTSTIGVDGKTKVQVFDADASDGVSPWLLLNLEFVQCRSGQ